MNRIDLRPAAQVPGNAEGGHLQRRMLQALERQWLDSWGLAHASQPDAAWASSSQDGVSPAPASGRSAAEGGPSAPVAASPMAGHAPETARQAAHDDEPDRTPEPVPQQASARSAEATVDRRNAPTVQGVSPEGIASQAAGMGTTASPPGGAAAGARRAAASMPSLHQGSASLAEPQQPSAVAGMTGSVPGSLTPGATLRLDASPAMEAPREAAWAALSPTSSSPSGLGLSAARPGLAPAASEPEEPDAAGRSAAPWRQRTAPDGDHGPQRLTLRELGQDQVLASLRDTRLDHAASQLAAQGLARALMETGYAQVKVVVNGRHSRDEPLSPDDATAPDPLHAEFRHPSTDSATKASPHGN